MWERSASTYFSWLRTVVGDKPCRCCTELPLFVFVFVVSLHGAILWQCWSWGNDTLTEFRIFLNYEIISYDAEKNCSQLIIFFTGHHRQTVFFSEKALLWNPEHYNETDRSSEKANYSLKIRLHSSGAVRSTSWAVRPNEPSGFRGRKAILNHASTYTYTSIGIACP